MSPPLNIALLGRDFLWGGGTEFLRNLANGLLSAQYEKKLRLFLLLPVKNRIDNARDMRWIIGRVAQRFFRQREFYLPRPEPVFDSSVPDYFLNVDGKIEIIEYNDATGLIPTLEKIDADVVMPAGRSLGESFPFPWIGYVYDFQHKYFSHYFSARECLCRDIHFATLLRDAKALLVNAKAVGDDIDKFYPYSECEIFNLPFSASSVPNWLETDGSEVGERYLLPKKYFLISNQFWIHKAHITAFRALSMLMSEPDLSDIHIVCTGKMEDYRFPDHIRELLNAINDLGIRNRVHLLGHIPKIDQISIMKRSLAVLQPTLFEGGPGGGSVYDAISLGVPAILSDIPVNREIEGQENLFYFEAGSAGDLSEKIKFFLKEDIRRPTKEKLVEQGERRRRLLGERLMEVVSFVRH